MKAKEPSLKDIRHQEVIEQATKKHTDVKALEPVGSRWGEASNGLF